MSPSLFHTKYVAPIATNAVPRTIITNLKVSMRDNFANVSTSVLTSQDGTENKRIWFYVSANDLDKMNSHAVAAHFNE